MNNNQKKIRNQLKNHLVYGDFILSDMRSSRWWLDLPSVLLDWKCLDRIAREIVSRISKDKIALSIAFDCPIGIALIERIFRRKQIKILPYKKLLLICPLEPTQTLGKPNVACSFFRGEIKQDVVIYFITDILVTGSRFIEIKELLPNNDIEFITIIDRRSKKTKAKFKELNINIDWILEWNKLLSENKINMEWPKSLDLKYLEVQSLKIFI